MRARGESVSSANSGSVDESPFEEDTASPNPNTAASVPSTPFSRRMSFGAARTLGRNGPTSAGGGGGQNGGNNNGNGRAPGSSPSSVAFKNKASASSPSGAAKSRGLSCYSFGSLSPTRRSFGNFTDSYGDTEGFDFAENLRARAERSSISSGMFGGTGPQSPQMPHNRSKSVAMEPPKSELPKQTPRPDAFQERILKGDFYMD
jgi:hypothetical protein